MENCLVIIHLGACKSIVLIAGVQAVRRSRANHKEGMYIMTVRVVNTVGRRCVQSSRFGCGGRFMIAELPCEPPATVVLRCYFRQLMRRVCCCNLAVSCWCTLHVHLPASCMPLISAPVLPVPHQLPLRDGLVATASPGLPHFGTYVHNFEVDE